MRPIITITAFILCGLAVFSQSPPQPSGTDAQLRGVSAVSAQVAWASGAQGTVLRTVDGGAHWAQLSVAGAGDLDFRDIQAFDRNTAYILSIGPGEQSRIYKTTDAGRHWALQFTNQNPKAFYDCFAFRDARHGIAVSDSVDGKFPLLITEDGSTWKALVPAVIPAALPSEGAFAASGTCITTFGKTDVWFATGGPAARVFHSADAGRHWTVASSPIVSGQPSQGNFSIAFWSTTDGVVVGGDYQHPEKAGKTAALTHDGGRTWKLADTPPAGYRSGVAMWRGEPMRLIAVGTSGSSFSEDGGRSWMPAGEIGLNAISCAQNRCFSVGPQGRIYINGVTASRQGTQQAQPQQ